MLIFLKDSNAIIIIIIIIIKILKPDEELSYYGYRLEPFRSYAFTTQSYNRHSLSVPYILAEVKIMGVWVVD